MSIAEDCEKLVRAKAKEFEELIKKRDRKDVFSMNQVAVSCIRFSNVGLAQAGSATVYCI